MRELLRIGEAAARAGVSERTLRYYEQLGLLAPAAHSPGGNRQYGEAELERVRRIRELQELMGFPLEEIREILAEEDRLADLRAAWSASDTEHQRREIIEDALATRLRLKARVSAKRDQLAAYLRYLDEGIARLEDLRAQCTLESSRTR